MELNTTTPSTSTEPHVNVEGAQHEKAVRFRIALFGFFLFIVFLMGLFWMFTSPSLTVGLTLSFVAGLSMIFLPCTLPLAFVIVPLTMGKDPKKGLFMALSFTLGLTITLSLYGVFIAAVGKTFGLKSDAEVYAVLFGGMAAFIFGLSEIGLIKFKLPSYSGKFPDFIQRQKDYMKTFFLGLLLGNVGVGCPNPAFYVLLGYIATTGDLFNGWFLGFIHGLGRSVPLIFLAILGTLGVNALSSIAKHKEAVERAMGWALVIIGSYLLTFGIFGHDWFIASGIHGGWEGFINSIGGERFGEVVLKHEHRLVDIPNFIQYGNMFFLGLLALTMSAGFIIKRPPKRTILWLSGIYIVLALIIGYSTGWTFRVGANMHISFRGEMAAPHGKAPATVPGDHEAGHGAAQYHEETAVQQGLAVNLNFAPMPVLVGTSTKLDFFVNQKPGNVPVPISDLEIEHTKLMHVIGVRDDMNEFFHIHPQSPLDIPAYFVESPPGNFNIDYIFQQPGRYKIWSQVTKDGVTHTFGHPEIDVCCYGVRSQKEVNFARNVVIANYQVALKLNEPVIKAHEHDLSFDVRTLTGKEIEVEPYLGADMHVVVIKDDLKQFIHTHPEGHGMMETDMNDQHGAIRLIHEVQAHGDEEEPPDSMVSGSEHSINFHIVFPEAGLYKVFAQFRPKGTNLPPDEALTASFWVQVAEKSPTPAIFKNWWLNFFGALALMALLSWRVKKFLSPEPHHESLS